MLRRDKLARGAEIIVAVRLMNVLWSREEQNDIGLQAIKTNKKGQIKTDIKSDNCPLYYGFRKHKIDADAREKEGN